ncbi:hypothetical protein SNEBB_008098, partial [Seison nebaliae]
MDREKSIIEFPYEDLDGKRNLLKSFNIRYGKPEDVVLQGYNNPDDCGVCLTNAVFALIISSNLLMDEVRNMETKDPYFIRYFMLKVKRDPYLVNDKPVLPLINEGDLLRNTFIETNERRFSRRSTFGFAGEYYLLKSYLQTVCINDRVRPIPPGDTIESGCDEILETKIQGFPYDAWGPILKDLFLPRQLTEEKFEFPGLEVLQATYYNEIDFLSILWLEDNKPILDDNRLNPNFLHMMGRRYIPQLKDYIEDNSLVPKHIAINSENLLTKQLHPLTYQNFFECLEELNDSPRHVVRFVCPDLEIPYDRRGEKLPLNFNQANLQQSFFSEGRELFYKVTGITFLALGVDHNIENMDFILRRNILQVINLDNVEIKQCEANMLRNLMEYITIVRERLDLAALAQRLENDLRYFMQNICFYQKEAFAIPKESDTRPCHFFT